MEETIGEQADMAQTGILGRDADGGLSNGQAHSSTSSRYDNTRSTVHQPPADRKGNRLARLAAKGNDGPSEESLQADKDRSPVDCD